MNDTFNFKEWSSKKIIEEAEKIAEELLKSRKSLDTQLRKIYDYILKERGRGNEERIPMLRAKLAYAVSRNYDLYPLFNAIDEKIKNAEDVDIKKLADFMESVIAYYKFKPVKEKIERRQ